MWRNRYEVAVDDRPLAAWDSNVWKSGGTAEVAGRRYPVRGNLWGNRFTMADESGAPIAAADRVGRRKWTVESAGRTYQFRRKSWWNGTQELYADDNRIGYVKRVSAWRSDVAADLPGLPVPVQVFVLGVVIAMWDAENTGG